MRKNNVITLTEADLHNMVMESVVRSLMNEGYTKEQINEWFGSNMMKGLKNAFGGDVNRVKQGAQNTYNNVKQGAQNMYNGAKEGMQNAYNGAKQGVQKRVNAFQAGVNASKNDAQVKKAVQTLTSLQSMTTQSGSPIFGTNSKTGQLLQQLIKSLQGNITGRINGDASAWAVK